jgi:eukaryotic-like serine/threonine-protein kinase
LEGVSASRVNHPNAVAVLDSGITPTGIAYLVMELLEGRSLTNELALKRVFSVKRAVEIAIPVCEALAEAHKVGIIHRDIKPDNIFLHRLKETEVVKVVDFGLAKMLSATADETLRAMTMAGSLMGTPGFMAPERITDQPYDGRVDIYSLGVVLYQMLTGRLPFVSEEGQAYAVLMMQLTEEPPAVRELNPLVPPALASIITMTLQKEPAGRPTAGELLAMLQKVYPLTDSATEVPANITTKDYRQKQTRIRPRTDTTAEAVVKTSLLPPKREPT